MTKKEFLRAKIYRLEELRKYQSYYGPNTPYPVIVEINELEAEIRRLKQPPVRRQAQVVKKKKKANSSIWHMSQPTFDAVATIAFIGLIFLLGSIIFAAYVQTRPSKTQAAANNVLPPVSPTLRPTFTPTADPDNPAPPPAQAVDSGSSDVAIVAIDNPNLPSPVQEATPVPTQVATLTPRPSPTPTEIPPPTETPVPTNTPVPTSPPPPPVAAAPQSAMAEPAAAESPPAPAEPSFPFMIGEQGNREFQHTTYHGITIYVAVVSEGNIPLGGYKVVGDQVPSGRHIESGLSDWNWSVVNCLDCDYIKQGNLKFEPGSFEDGIWNIYLTDQNGAPLSPTLSLSYSSNPDTWVWDFVIFRRKSG